MCLGIPGKVTEVYGAEGLQMGMVDFGGVRREVCLAYVADEVQAVVKFNEITDRSIYYLQT